MGRKKKIYEFDDYSTEVRVPVDKKLKTDFYETCYQINLPPNSILKKLMQKVVDEPSTLVELGFVQKEDFQKGLEDKEIRDIRAAAREEMDNAATKKQRRSSEEIKEEDEYNLKYKQSYARYYQRKAYKAFGIRLNINSEADVVEQLNAHRAKTKDYLKSLIRADMMAHGQPDPDEYIPSENEVKALSEEFYGK